MIYNITRQQIFQLLLISSLFYGCSKYETVLVPEDSKKEEALDPTEEIFDLHKMSDLPEIKLTVTLKDWNTFLDNYDTNEDNKEKVVSNFEFKLNGTTVQLDSIGLRLRGNSSRERPEGNKGEEHTAGNTDWHHCHFGLDFNKFIKGQKFNALKNLNLKWFKGDASYARNIYCYDLFEKYGVWTAPQASYCRLTIHVEGDTDPAYYGVYAMMEALNEDFIENREEHWGASVGNLWKCGYAGRDNATLETPESIGVEVVTLDGVNNTGYAYDLKTNKNNIGTARAELIDFINNLNTKTGSDFEQWIDTKMDVSLFLKTYAVNVMVGMWDDYWANGNNYYLYMGTDGKVVFIPYDYDNTLGVSAIVNNAGTENPLKWGDTGTGEKPLINKILAISKYKEEYKSYLKELIDPNKDLFDFNKSTQRLSTWRTLVKLYVANDTNEDEDLIDEAVSWGNRYNYSLFTGDDQGGNGGTPNFFKTRTKAITW